MAMFCCCSKLRSRKSPYDGGEAGLPARPPPARLSPAAQTTAFSPQSTAARSSLTNPLPGATADASVQLGELIVEDSDDENADDDLDHNMRNRSASTLQAVKSRIRRHLSQDSLSRQSETEEQIARRAEVKRLMRKRIQEELQSESGQAPSESSTTQRPGPGSVNLPGNGPRDTIEFTVDETKAEQELATAKSGHLCKSSNDKQRRLSNSLSNDCSVKSSGHEMHPERRAASLQKGVDVSPATSDVERDKESRNSNSLPEIPTSPVIQPVQAPSLHDNTSFASWRLSLSPDKLAELLTPDQGPSVFHLVADSPSNTSTIAVKNQESLKLLRSKSSPLFLRAPNAEDRQHSRQTSLGSTYQGRIPESRSLIRDESPVGLWLRTQSQQFRISTASAPDSDCISESRLGTDQQPGTTNVHHGKDFTVRIGQGCLHQSERQSPPTFPPNCRPSLSSPEPTGQLSGSKPGNHNQANIPHSEFDPGSVHILQSNANTISHYNSPAPLGCATSSSSVDKDTLGLDISPSIQTAVRKGFGGFRFPLFKWNYPATKSRNGNEQPGPSVISPALSNARKVPREMDSETPSLFGQEAELKNVEGCSRDSRLRNETLVTGASKFQEVLSEDSTSLLPRVHSTQPETAEEFFIAKLDGAEPESLLAIPSVSRTSGMKPSLGPMPSNHERLKVPSAEYGVSRARPSGRFSNQSKKSDESVRSRGFSCSKDGDETAQLWRRAMRAESISRSPRGSTSFPVPVPQVKRKEWDHHGRLPRVPQPSEGEGHSGSDSHSHSPTCNEVPTQDDEEQFRKSLMRSNKVLEDWARQLDKQEREAKVKSRSLTSAAEPTIRVLKIPPSSWTKFPSHNREERNAAAGEADQVKPKDFAVKEVSPEGHITWTTDKRDDDATNNRNTGRPFSERFTKLFKPHRGSPFSKYVASLSRNRSTRGVRRSSIELGGDLEFPELELLPTAGGYKELCTLEREINEMKGMSDAGSGPYKREMGAMVRSSMSEQMNNELSHDGCSDARATDSSCLGGDQARLARPHSPATPVTQIRYWDAHMAADNTSSSSGRYETPLSHVSSDLHAHSRALTPQINIQSPLSSHSTSSDNSPAPTVRRASFSLPAMKHRLEAPLIRSGS